MELQFKAQTKWRWILAIYLFTAGLGGGAYLTGVIADILKWDVLISKIGIVIGFPCVFIGTMFLIIDLGKPINFWRAFMKPSTSWIARGTLIISFFMILNFIHIIFWVWPFSHILEDAGSLRLLLGIVTALLAIATMVYTGILLAASRPLAFWSTAILPMLFLVSATSTGIMAVLLISSLAGAQNGLVLLEKLDILLLVAEVFVLIFYLQATHRVPESRASAKVVLSGAAAMHFWFGVVLFGLLVPLTLEILGAYVFTGSLVKIAVVAGTACGIFGGFMLRQVILMGGIHAPLKAGRFEYALTNV